MVAARKGSVGMVRKLTQKGATVNFTNEVNELVWWVLEKWRHVF